MSLSRWLDVEVGTDDIELNTLPGNLALADLQNDGEYKLLVADFGKADEGPKVKIFRGTMQVSDIVLPILPLGLVTFYTNDSMPRSTPAIAIAFSSCVCIYKNLKMFYKYYLPTAEVSTCEIDIWKQLLAAENQNQNGMAPLIDSLKALPNQILTSQSQTLLSLSTEHQLDFVEQITELPSKKTSEIVGITSMKMSSVDRYSTSCLVIGTEDGHIIILDPQNFTQLLQARVNADKRTPYQIIATGLYNVGFRIAIATREKSVCILKRDWTEGRTLFCTDEHIIAIEVVTGDNSIMVICADNTMSCYNRKGNKQWHLSLEHRPVSLTLVPVLQLGVTLTAVALASGHLHLYDGKARRDSLFVRDVVSVMKFGQLGQEEHVFIIITAGGNLMLKILKRTADFNSTSAGVETSLHQVVGKPWMIPKKSKLFLEQAARERENAISMHESFQLELSRVRVAAARALLESHRRSDNCVAAGTMEPVRLAAEVEGLGPVFRMILIVHNSSTNKAVVGLAVLFHVHTTHYRVSNPYIKVPLLSPGSKIEFPVTIEEIFDDFNPDVFFRSVTGQGGDRALVKILLLKEGRSSPVLAATVQMPPTDPMMLPYDKIQATADFGNPRSQEF